LPLSTLDGFGKTFSLKNLSITASPRVSNGNANRNLAVLCAIALSEEPYLQEWVDYNIGLGFDLVYIFDNSDSHEIKKWQEEQSDHVRIVHFPGISMQTEAYR
jgi:hypothetical protein